MLKINARRYREEQDTTRFFPCGIEELMLPLIHIGALTKSAPPQVTKTQVLTKSTRSPSSKWWISNCLHQYFLKAPTISQSSPRTLQTPRPSRSRQSPRVTVPHTFTWPEHSAKPWYALWNPWSLRKSSPNKRRWIPNGQNTNSFSPWML
jgi:hypothetical protein